MHAPSTGWAPYGVPLDSRLLLGTAGYPSPHVLAECIRLSGTQVVTVGLSRTMAAAGDNGFVECILDATRNGRIQLLPNTAGCRTALEAVTLAHMARELYGTRWIKLEVVGDEHTLQPDPWGTVDAAKQLIRDGFCVFPYCTDDLVTCRRLLDAGCEVLMPWGAPIGSGQGLINPFALRTLRARLPGVPLVVDAGIGAPSHAALALELGMDAVLLNSAVSQAVSPPHMAEAFGHAVRAGRLAFNGGIMAPQDMAVATTPVVGGHLLVG